MESLTYCGEINLILGPMFSGKSTELLRLIGREQYAKRRCLLIKHSIDSRYSQSCVSTHDQIQQKAIAVSTLADAFHLIQDVDVVGIDEGQFFDDVVDFAEKCANLGKRVIIAALDGTFERKPFNDILHLVPRAESVKKLKAICVECGCDAHFSKRISNETGDVVVGGADKYIACCRSCYFEEKRESVTPSKMAPHIYRSPFCKKSPMREHESPIMRHDELQ